MDKEKWDALSNEELCTLYQKEPSNELFEYFLERNTALMYSFVNKYLCKFPESEQDDILQHCKIEMWEAMNRFNPDKQVNFTTYYYFYVKRALSMYLRRANLGGIQLPAWLMTKKARETHADVIEMSHTTSLNNVVLNDGQQGEIIDLVTNPDDIDGDQYIEQCKNHEGMRKALQILKPKEQIILEYYFGLRGDKRYTLEEIGQLYGVSRERIRQIITIAIKRLRLHIHEYLDVPKCTLDRQTRVYLCDDSIKRTEDGYVIKNQHTTNGRNKGTKKRTKKV